MHYADIHAALIKCGWPPSRIADHLGVERSAVSQVTRGTATSYNIASTISAKTGIALRRLWPDGRYSQPSRPARRVAV